MTFIDNNSSVAAYPERQDTVQPSDTIVQRTAEPSASRADFPASECSDAYVRVGYDQKVFLNSNGCAPAFKRAARKFHSKCFVVIEATLREMDTTNIDAYKSSVNSALDIHRSKYPNAPMWARKIDKDSQGLYAHVEMGGTRDTKALQQETILSGSRFAKKSAFSTKDFKSAKNLFEAIKGKKGSLPVEKQSGREDQSEWEDQSDYAESD